MSLKNNMPLKTKRKLRSNCEYTDVYEPTGCRRTIIQDWLDYQNIYNYKEEVDDEYEEKMEELEIKIAGMLNQKKEVLSDHQGRVLDLMVEGIDYNHIAKILNVNYTAIPHSISGIMKKDKNGNSIYHGGSLKKLKKQILKDKELCLLLHDRYPNFNIELLVRECLQETKDGEIYYVWHNDFDLHDFSDIANTRYFRRICSLEESSKNGGTDTKRKRRTKKDSNSSDRKQQCTSSDSNKTRTRSINTKAFCRKINTKRRSGKDVELQS